MNFKIQFIYVINYCTDYEARTILGLGVSVPMSVKMSVIHSWLHYLVFSIKKSFLYL
jgi:hypothetical protein